MEIQDHPHFNRHGEESQVIVKILNLTFFIGTCCLVFTHNKKMDRTIRLVDLKFKKCLSLLINLFHNPEQSPDF